MKLALLAFGIAFALIGCASITPQQRYASHSTLQLQVLRYQLHRSIPKWQFGYGIVGAVSQAETKKKQIQINEIELELVRRYELGDKRAKLVSLSDSERPVFRWN